MTTFSLEDLAASIRSLHEHFSSQARHAINVTLTLRNWLIGWYIAEYQLNGSDRAKYGEKIIFTLAEVLADLPNCDHRGLYNYLAFYRCYPQLLQASFNQVSQMLPEALQLCFQTISATTINNHSRPICGTAFRKLGNNSNTPNIQDYIKLSPDLLSRLSYNHFAQLIKVSDETARRFYETERLLGNWSVRELKRQIGSMFYERTALSADKEKGGGTSDAGRRTTATPKRHEGHPGHCGVLSSICLGSSGVM